VEASWFEARETVDGDWASPAGIVATDMLPAAPVDPVAPAGPGEPQTSQ
jgi:hypothetical protein